jgi:uncharacterized membrane protein YuzA (DUF378 family)
VQGKELIFLNIVAMILVIIGAINWGLIGFFQFDLVAAIFGGQSAVLSRIIYALVGLAGLWCIMLVPRVRHRKEK